MSEIISQTETRYCSHCDKYFTVTVGDCCRLPSFTAPCPHCGRQGETLMGRAVRKLAEKIWPF